MKKEEKILEVRSYNDIITNSSTEIYSSEANKNLKRTLTELGADWFSPECFDDILGVIKRNVGREFKDRYFLCDIELGINRTGRNKSENRELPKLTSDGYEKLKLLGYTDERISEFFDPIYKELGVYGKIYITFPHMVSLKYMFPGHPKTASKFTSLGTD